MIAPSDLHLRVLAGNYNSKQILISLQQFLDMITNPRTRRAINILDLPVVGPNAEMGDYLVLVAWNAVGDRPYFRSLPFPQNDFSWFIAASAGTSHGWHVDAEGLNTDLQVLVGQKVWFVAVPATTFLPSSFLYYARPLQGYERKLPSGWRIFVVLLTQNSHL
jgi:hypothetical protein